MVSELFTFFWNVSPHSLGDKVCHIWADCSLKTDNVITRIHYGRQFSDPCMSTLFNLLHSPLFKHSAPPHFKLKYFADGDVFKVIWFREMLTQVPEFKYHHCLRVTKNMRDCANYLLASTTCRTVYKPQMKSPFKWQCPVSSQSLFLAGFCTSWVIFQLL